MKATFRPQPQLHYKVKCGSLEETYQEPSNGRFDDGIPERNPQSADDVARAKRRKLESMCRRPTP